MEPSQNQDQDHLFQVKKILVAMFESYLRFRKPSWVNENDPIPADHDKVKVCKASLSAIQNSLTAQDLKANIDKLVAENRNGFVGQIWRLATLRSRLEYQTELLYAAQSFLNFELQKATDKRY